MLRPTAGFAPVPPPPATPSHAAIAFALAMALGAALLALLSCPAVRP